MESLEMSLRENFDACNSQLLNVLTAQHLYNSLSLLALHHINISNTVLMNIHLHISMQEDASIQ